MERHRALRPSTYQTQHVETSLLVAHGAHCGVAPEHALNSWWAHHLQMSSIINSLNLVRQEGRHLA
eukprot:5195127-Amphidinium_carterae.1